MSTDAMEVSTGNMRRTTISNLTLVASSTLPDSTIATTSTIKYSRDTLYLLVHSIRIASLMASATTTCALAISRASIVVCISKLTSTNRGSSSSHVLSVRCRNPTPHSHTPCDVLPAAARSAPGQAVQFLAPVCVWYVCMGQSSHAALPTAVLNFPAAQSAHGPELGPLLPDGHSHFAFTKTRPSEQPLQCIEPTALTYPASHAHVELPRGALEFTPHATHAVAPRVAEYVFSAQSRHSEWSMPDLYLPAAHTLHRYA